MAPKMRRAESCRSYTRLRHARDGRLELQNPKKDGPSHTRYHGPADSPMGDAPKRAPVARREGEGRKGDGLGVTDLPRGPKNAEKGESVRHREPNPDHMSWVGKRSEADPPSACENSADH